VSYRKQVTAVRGSIVGVVQKTTKGYKFAARTAVEKAKTIAAIKKRIPSARITTAKA
jgi:hypothetical protein